MTTILLVEDTYDLAQVIIRELEASGYQVLHASDGLTALRLHSREHPALVILDWMIPKMDGLEVLRRVRHFAQAHKPIAAICHGVQILAAAGVIEGKSCTAYPAVGPEVKRAGGKWVDIAVDGGIASDTAGRVASAGANVLVAGSAIFKNTKPDGYHAKIAAIRNAALIARGEAA